DELVVREGRVDLRVLVERVHHGPGDEGQVGEAEALLGLPLVLLGSADPLDALVVDLDRGVDVGRGVERAPHVLGGALADVRVGHDRVALARGPHERRRGGAGRRARRGGRRGGRGRGGRGGTAATLRLDDREHVVAGDAPADAGAGDLARVEAVLVDEPAHDRREDLAAALGGGRRRRSGRGRRRGRRGGRGGGRLGSRGRGGLGRRLRGGGLGLG